MPRLVRNSDGTIGLVHEDGTKEAEKHRSEEQLHGRAKAIKESKTPFKSLSQDEKDQLLELLLIRHNLI